MTALHSSIRKSGSERPASSGENSISSTSVLAKATCGENERPGEEPTQPRWGQRTILEAVSRHCARVMFSLCSRWMSDDARKVCIRWSGAWCTASWQRAMSFLLARARPAIRIVCEFGLQSVSVPADSATRLTASKSPCEAIGKPASQMSTPSRASCLPISTFSSAVSVAPGDCSPSRSVVSNIQSFSLTSTAAAAAVENAARRRDDSVATPRCTGKLRLERRSSSANVKVIFLRGRISRSHQVPSEPPAPPRACALGTPRPTWPLLHVS